MDMLNATDVRKNWSYTLDSVVREKPAYVKRTHDSIAMIGIPTLNEILSGYHFYADEFKESDGSITLSLKDMDIVVNDVDHDRAMRRLAAYIKEYAEEYYSDFDLMSKAVNRRSHIPYVFKALTIDENSILEDIICQDGNTD